MKFIKERKNIVLDVQLSQKNIFVWTIHLIIMTKFTRRECNYPLWIGRLEKKYLWKGWERGKLSRIQGTRCPYRTLVKADPPKKQHKFDPEVWLSPRRNLTSASRSLSSVTYAWKKVRMLQKSPENAWSRWYNSSCLVNSFHLANIYVNMKNYNFFCCFILLRYYDNLFDI